MPHQDGRHLASLTDKEKATELADFSVSPEQWGNFLCTLFDEWVKQDVGTYYIQLFDSTLANWVGEQPGVCSMAKTCGHAGVMEFNGDVYACDHFVFPEYKLGNIYQKTLVEMMYSERQQAFGQMKQKSLPTQCRECEWLFACNGECPKNRFAHTADGEPGLNYLCAGYRKFFKHVAPYMDFMKQELMNQRPPANIMKVTKYLIAAVAVLTVCSARADEGMWLLQLMKQQNSIDMMKKQGLKLAADDLYNPNGVSLKDAVGIFGGGCTGEIISPEGLILTNHHCGYGAIQQHSSVEHDYLTDGFWAKSRNEELPTPGLKFRFVHRIVDITDLVNAKVKAGEVTEVDALTAPFLGKLAKEELEKSDLKGKPGIEVRALPFYAGNKFYLFYYKVYSDVRMVAAPPSSVGKFGGETDNWMWPRHTGDFSMFRIYADANGEPAEYNASNVPLKTPKFLSISIKGLKENDYAMIMGFPGSTSRYLTRSEVKERMEADNQAMMDMRGVRLDVLRKYMDASDKTRIQYASKFAGSSNYWKKLHRHEQGNYRQRCAGHKSETGKELCRICQR